MKCPICRNETDWRHNPYRPFCSERCKMIDLDHWLSERYRIPGAGTEQEDPELASPSSSEEDIA